MPFIRTRILYVTLGFLCLSLMGPGIWELLRISPGSPGLVAQHVDALNQLRAYNGMITAVGVMSGFATLFSVSSLYLRLNIFPMKSNTSV